MKILCIYNPHSGGGNSMKYLEEIKSLFMEFAIEAEIVFTEYPLHSSEIVADAELANYDGLIVAGGDGSFFNVLNAYMKKPDKDKIPLGVLPVGTGNSLSRDILETGTSLRDFVELIKSGKTKRFDIAKVQSGEEVFYFANMMGFGFITDVSATAARLKMFKKMSYTLGVLYNTIKLNTFDLTITIDGKEQIWDNVFVIISNSKYTGGDYLIAPRAEVDDGKLDLVVLNRLSRINLLKIFPKIYDGSHVDSEFVDYIQASNIKLRTNVPKILSPDGEVFGHFPADVACLPRAIEVFAK